MAGYLKAALYAATFLCASQAQALTFTIGSDAPAIFTLSAPGSTQDNRAVYFDATVSASVATSFQLTLSTFDYYCSINSCGDVAPGGFMKSTLTFNVDPTGIRRSYNLSLPGTRGYPNDVDVVFSTMGSVPITFSNLVVTKLNIPLVPAIPEPATWALMLVGFGMMGYALRRRRARVVFA